jgi:outer membrane receptor for ferrienterochelin and colicin
VLEGSSKFDSEYVTAYELGYRGQVNSRLSGSLTTFYNDYKDVRSVGLTPVTQQ